MAIELIDKIKQKNNGTFALVDATDVDMGDGKRLSDKEFFTEADVKTVISDLFVPCTQAEYDALVSAGTVDENKYYMIVGDSE